eukprot:gene29782-36877_t
MVPIILCLAMLSVSLSFEIAAPRKALKFSDVFSDKDHPIKEYPMVSSFLEESESFDGHLTPHWELEDVQTHVPIDEIQALLDFYWATVYDDVYGWYFGSRTPANGFGYPWQMYEYDVTYGWEPIYTATADMNPCSYNWFGVTCDCDTPQPGPSHYYTDTNYYYAYSNSHKLSPAICNATGLVTLAMDGINSQCGSSDSTGSIPSCLFAMPVLKTLHLSGNRLE